MSAEHLANATREQLLEHVAVQREVIGRLNWRVLDLESALGDALEKNGGSIGETAPGREASTALRANASRSLHPGVSELDPTPHSHVPAPHLRTRAEPDTRRPVPQRHQHQQSQGRDDHRSQYVSEMDATALQKIDAVLDAHLRGCPALPAGIVAELLYIREQLTSGEEESAAEGAAPRQGRGGSRDSRDTTRRRSTPSHMQQQQRQSVAQDGSRSRAHSSNEGSLLYRGPGHGATALPQRTGTSMNSVAVKWVSPKASRVVYRHEGGARDSHAPYRHHNGAHDSVDFGIASLSSSYDTI